MATKRGSFTLQEKDLALIQEIKLRCMKQGIETNKSEIIRAAIYNFSGLNDNGIKYALQKIPKIKAGRPTY